MQPSNNCACTAQYSQHEPLTVCLSPTSRLGGTVGAVTNRPVDQPEHRFFSRPSRQVERLEANKLFQRAAWKGRATILVSPKTALTELNAGGNIRPCSAG